MVLDLNSNFFDVAGVGLVVSAVTVYFYAWMMLGSTIAPLTASEMFNLATAALVMITVGFIFIFKFEEGLKVDLWSIVMLIGFSLACIAAAIYAYSFKLKREARPRAVWVIASGTLLAIAWLIIFGYPN